MKEPPFVVAIWHDAWADNEEFVKTEKVDENHKPIVIKTVGWLLVDDKEGLSIFNERADEEDAWRGRTFVSRGMIVSVTPHKLASPRKRKPKPLPSPPEASPEAS